MLFHLTSLGEMMATEKRTDSAIVFADGKQVKIAKQVINILILSRSI